MSRFLDRLKAWAERADVWPILWRCLPALVIALLLRGALCYQMPHAFFHPDSEQVFDTYQGLLAGELVIHEKKTPLGPLLYCVPPLLGLPILPTIAIWQHLLGLGIVVMIGALVAKSFVHGRIFIMPVTVAVAVNPILLWYEHTALPETFYVFSIVGIALSGLLYTRRPTMLRLLALGAALFCTAGFRPEGKLFFLFGLALVVWQTWGQWKKFALSTGGMALLTMVSFSLNETRQGGSLLYSNIAQLTPASLWSAPGLAEAHREYFAGLREKWAVTPTFYIPRERRQLFGFVRAYLAARPGKPDTSSEAVNALCGRIGAEVCLRNLHRMPAVALAKFRVTLPNPAADDFGADWLFRKQVESVAGDVDTEDLLAADAEESRGLGRIAYGRTFLSRAEFTAHLRQIYRPFDPDWLTEWQEAYSAGILAWRLPDRKLVGLIIPGMPYLYVGAVAGLIALAFRNRAQRSYHLLWLGMLLFMAFVLTVTGSNLGRFRIGFEPFWFLYACGLLDVVLGALRTRADDCAGQSRCVIESGRRDEESRPASGESVPG